MAGLYRTISSFTEGGLITVLHYRSHKYQTRREEAGGAVKRPKCSGPSLLRVLATGWRFSPIALIELPRAALSVSAVGVKTYVPGNVQIISWRANDIKKNATLEELEHLVVHLRNWEHST